MSDYPREIWHEEKRATPKGDTAYDTATKLLKEEEDYLPQQDSDRQRLRELAAIHAQLALTAEVQQICELFRRRFLERVQQIIPKPQPANSNYRKKRNHG